MRRQSARFKTWYVPHDKWPFDKQKNKGKEWTVLLKIKRIAET